jgi:quinoprotein glucose dehydrogenase
MNWSIGLLCLLPFAGMAADVSDWPVYGGDAGGRKYSPLKQINLENVASLEVAWTFHTGDAYQPKYDRPTAFEATPLYVGGALYIGTPLGRVIAIDPVAGQERWSFDGKVPRDKGYGDFANRGVSSWKAADGHRRIYIATLDARLIALDAATGKPCADFGDNGVVDLRPGLRIAPRGYADYEETSPPAVIGDTIVVGSGVADNGSVNQPSGEVRAYDARTGRKKWTWDPIPQDPKAAGADTWKNESAKKTGAANAWSIVVSDPERSLGVHSRRQRESGLLWRRTARLESVRELDSGAARREATRYDYHVIGIEDVKFIDDKISNAVRRSQIGTRKGDFHLKIRDNGSFHLEQLI